ncbi:hypothetical protein ACQ9BO_05055 [Flavobacterium sp. P21]|uniref:hypothetical protein n=1 Tax=Flavobacterium sp. P21 TaxID=3423948 RepID=UPI003D6797CD
MRKTILTIFLLAFCTLIFGQEKSNKISIEFKNADLKTALENIEKATNYKFYFDENWLKSEPVLINKTYNNVSIEDLLRDLFEKTTLNYFISNNVIILTKSSTIHTSLPDDYFDKTTPQPEKPSAKPVFHQQYDTITRNRNVSGIVYIGKEKKEQN